MSSHDPDQIESSGSYNGGATTTKTDGNTQRGSDVKPMENKKKVFVKNQYHGAFGGTTKLELNYWRQQSMTLLAFSNPNYMFELQER